jgi:hypothetical protein
LLATPQIAGAITFAITGQATAPVTPPNTAPCPISPTVASAPLSIIGCVAPNPVPTTPDRIASDPTHFAHARYPPPIGAVSASSPHTLLADLCLSVIFHSQAFVISSPIFLNHSQAVLLAVRHLSARLSAHTRSSPPAISGQVTF